MNRLADLISNKEPIPGMNMRGLPHADDFPDFQQALSGEVMSSMCATASRW